MKRIKITTIIILTLVMCLTMAFPASAANIVVSNMLVNYEAAKNDDWGQYIYRAYFYYNINTPYPDIRVFGFNTLTPKNGDTVAFRTYRDGAIVISTTYTWNGTIRYDYNQSGVIYPLGFNVKQSSSSFYTYNTCYLKSISDVKFDVNDGYIGELAEFVINTSALQSLISQAKSIQNTNYTQSSWNDLQSQITNAENLLATTGYTQAQVDNAKTALQASIDGLVTLPDTTELEALVEVADTVQDDGYAKPTWNRFTTARTSAHVLLASPIYTAPQVSSTTTELRTSMDSLRLLPDASALRDLIETARTYIDDKYTELSLEILNSKIMQSLILLDNEDYVAAQIDNAMSELWDAILGLVLIDNKPYEPPPIIVEGGHMWQLTPEQQKYADLLSGVKPKHLEPIKEAVEENMGVARGYGLWVWFLILSPLVIIIVVRGFINNMSSNVSLDMTHHDTGGVRLTAWKRKERSGKHWEQIK